MCKILEDMKNEAAAEAAREASILTTIEVYRKFNVDEDEIQKWLMERFNLSKESAKVYMLEKSA